MFNAGDARAKSATVATVYTCSLTGSFDGAQVRIDGCPCTESLPPLAARHAGIAEVTGRCIARAS